MSHSSPVLFAFHNAYAALQLDQLDAYSRWGTRMEAVLQVHQQGVGLANAETLQGSS
jgi:hypothetical protein